MLFDFNSISMMHLIRKEYIKKKREWKNNYGNRRIAVETGVLYNIYKDMMCVTRISSKITNEKYVYLILRNCMEQLIIFKFLCKRFQCDGNVFNDYLGDNISDDVEEQKSNEFEKLKAFGGKRTISYNNRFCNLAKEFEDIESDTSLYKLYGVLADYCHNSYYHSIVSCICNEKKMDIKFVRTIVLTILTQLYEEFERG